MDTIRNAEQLIEAARRFKGNNTVAVAMANDASVLQAVHEAAEEGIVNAILVGDQDEMYRIADQGGFSLDASRIEDVKDPVEASNKAVELIQSGDAQFLMKGFVKTAILLKAILKQPELKVRDILSHVAVLSIPGRDRLFLFTDGGMIPKPAADQKDGICRNMIDLARALGIQPFQFGFLAPYTDSLNNDHETVGKALTESDPGLVYLGDITPETAFEQADGVVVTEIEACNTITKGLTQYTDTVFSGLVMGVKAPVCLVSRSDTAANKKASLALGVLYANGGVS